MGKMKCALLLLAFCMLFTGCGQKTMPPDNGDNDQNADVGQNITGDAEHEKNDNINQNTEGAGNSGETNESKGLESGFKPTTSGEPLPPLRFTAYKSDKTTFDINNVTLEFFWAIYYQMGVEFEIERGKSYPYYDLYFLDEDFEVIQHIKHVEENLVSEKYNCEVIWEKGSMGDIAEVKFNYSENISIPAEVFSKERGMIYFSVQFWNEIFQRTETLSSIEIFYNVIGDTVILSAQIIE